MKEMVLVIECLLNHVPGMRPSIKIDLALTIPTDNFRLYKGDWDTSSSFPAQTRTAFQGRRLSRYRRVQCYSNEA